ncbi:hypothetical protein HK102_008484 [Quaeritorhiza haematococci]|nr:hypothetical protein HK102_008484 [Quaeritorhiza haematococci]
MQTLGIVESTTGGLLPGAALHLDGDFRFVQRNLLPVAETPHNLYDVPVLNYTQLWNGVPLEATQLSNMFTDSSNSASGFIWDQMVTRYMERDVRTNFDVPNPSWTFAARAPASSFVQQLPLHISGKIRYGEDSYAYRPGVWEVLKNGWIQYSAYLVLVAAFWYPLFGLAVRHQIMRTRVTTDRVPSAIVATAGAGGGGRFKPHLF